MKKVLYILTTILILTDISYSETALQFTQIIDTPDQVIGAEILKAAYKKLEIPIEIVTMPGKRALIESSEGRADGEIHRIFEIGNEYQTLVRVPTPINYIEPSVFSRKLNFNVAGCSELKDYHISIVRGVKHSELCTEGMKNVFIANNSSKMMKMLDAGGPDIIITARVNGLLLIKKMNLKSVFPLSPPLSRRLVYHYLHEKHKNIVPKINKIFIEMKKNGELKRLRDNTIKIMFKSAENK